MANVLNNDQPMIWLSCSDLLSFEPIVGIFGPKDTKIVQNQRNLGNIFPTEHNDGFPTILKLFLEKHSKGNVVVVGHSNCSAIKHAIDIATTQGEATSGSSNKSNKTTNGNTKESRESKDSGQTQIWSYDETDTQWLSSIVNIAQKYPHIGEEELSRKNVQAQVENIEATVQGWIKQYPSKFEDANVSVQGFVINDTPKCYTATDIKELKKESK